MKMKKEMNAGIVPLATGCAALYSIRSDVRKLKDLLDGCKVHGVERESDEGEGYSKQILK